MINHALMSRELVLNIVLGIYLVVLLCLLCVEVLENDNKRR